MQVIHTVGPMWQGGKCREKEDLHEAVAKALVETDKRGFSTVRGRNVIMMTFCIALRFYFAPAYRKLLGTFS